jgi:hypothetical protein
MESTAQYWKPVWGALERYWKPLERFGARLQEVARVDARTADLRKQIEEDQRRLGDRREVADVAQRAQGLNERAEKLHRRV